MVTVNRNLETPTPPTGWDPYAVWSDRVRSAARPAPRRVLLHPVGRLARSRAVLLRTLRVTGLLCV
jgi:hypothetical protein